MSARSKHWKVALAFAVTHLGIVAIVAIGVLADFQRERESPMLWLYLYLLDLPVSLGISLSKWVDSLPDIPWFPGLTGNWPNFLFPLSFFGTIGTLWWYFMGWLISKIYTISRRMIWINED